MGMIIFISEFFCEVSMKYITSFEEQHPAIYVLAMITFICIGHHMISILLTESWYQVTEELEFCSGNWEGTDTMDTLVCLSVRCYHW